MTQVIYYILYCTHMQLETANGELVGSKKSSRRKRRKPSNLRQEYMKRQHDNKVWLETHIWHAKRMKMVPQWGYSLAERSCNKGVRVNYRFMKKGSLISVGWMKGQVGGKGERKTWLFNAVCLIYLGYILLLLY